MALEYKFDWKQKTQQIKKEESEKKQSFSADERFWKLVTNDQKKGSAILRFLPDKEGTPYKQYFSHFFRFEGPRGVTVYSANCATSIGEKCLVCDKNREYWNSPFERDKNVARDRKRKIHFVSNVYVLKDPAQPENEGKVFLFDHGTQIHNKFKEEMFGPEDATEDELDDVNLYSPCAFEDGADFLLKAATRKGTDWVTYEPSKFKSQSRIFNELEDDEWEEKVNEVMSQTYMLDEWENSDKYPTDEKVSSRLASILGATEETAEQEDTVKEDDKPETEDPEMDTNEDSDSDMSDEDFFKTLE